MQAEAPYGRRRGPRGSGLRAGFETDIGRERNGNATGRQEDRGGRSVGQEVVGKHDPIAGDDAPLGELAGVDLEGVAGGFD